MISNVLFSWRPGGKFKIEKGTLDFVPDVVFYFAEMSVLKHNDVFGEIKSHFPKEAALIGCSTSKPILMDDIFEGFVTGIALKFEKTKLKIIRQSSSDHSQSCKIGKKIGQELKSDDLAHVFIVSDGMYVNGTTLLNGIHEGLGRQVPITGGMACDGNNFQETFVGLNMAPKEKEVVAIGFYGDALKVGYAAQGGWEPFGVDRIITKADDNILYELDGENALDLYIEYMGGSMDNLATRALMFPFSIRKDKFTKERIIRTFDKYDEKEKSLRFSGDIPQGYIAQFMKGNVENLSQGARVSAQMASQDIALDDKTVVLVVSCLGRQVAMGQRVGDEIDEIVKVFGGDVSLTGFYSHGEFCPLPDDTNALLHNQTMTLTILRED